MFAKGTVGPYTSVIITAFQVLHFSVVEISRSLDFWSCVFSVRSLSVTVSSQYRH